MPTIKKQIGCEYSNTYSEDITDWGSCVRSRCSNLSRKLLVQTSSWSGGGFTSVNAAWMAAHCSSAPFTPFRCVCVMFVMWLTSSWHCTRHARCYNQQTAKMITNGKVTGGLSTHAVVELLTNIA